VSNDCCYRVLQTQRSCHVGIFNARSTQCAMCTDIRNQDMELELCGVLQYTGHTSKLDKLDKHIAGGQD
jgi:hypothetical protein